MPDVVNDEPTKGMETAAAAETAAPQVQRRRSVRFELMLLLVFGAFAVLTALVTNTATQGIDVEITHAIQRIASPVFGVLMVVVSWAGFSPQSFVIVALIVALLYAFGLRWEALVAIIAVVLEEGLDLLVKLSIHRARPAPDVVHVVAKLNSYSFPSGHVTFYMGFFGFIWFLAFTLLKPSWKRTLLLVLFGVLILLIGLSRVWLGEHWASDVIGGYLLGSLTLIASIQLYRWGKARGVVHQAVAPEKERG